MPYSHFLAANASGGLVWAGGTTAVVYYLGIAAERWLSRFSWVALLLAVVIGVIFTFVMKERTAHAIAKLEGEHDWETLKGH